MPGAFLTQNPLRWKPSSLAQAALAWHWGYDLDRRASWTLLLLLLLLLLPPPPPLLLFIRPPRLHYPPLPVAAFSSSALTVGGHQCFPIKTSRSNTLRRTTIDTPAIRIIIIIIKKQHHQHRLLLNDILLLLLLLLPILLRPGRSTRCVLLYLKG